MVRHLLFVSVLMTFAAAAAGEPRSFAEPLRPQYHFSPAAHWINDPNGLVYFKHEYHLFFQYNPQGDTWGHMSWGHAVSTDLVHWHELPVAIAEDERAMIFSGSIVVDEHDTSGFAAHGGTPLVAVYTAAEHRAGGLQSQALAYSNDRGRTWTKFVGNPVLDLGLRNFRDPKVFWYEPRHSWIMAAVYSDRHQVGLFSSPDLKHWTHLSDFGPAGATDGAWECPDLFELSVDGDAADARWVLKVDVFRSAVAAGSGTQYFVGRFDGQAFTQDTATEAQWVDYGMDFYAAETWANLRPDEHRSIWIAWMNSHHYAEQIPTAPWRGAMSVPRELRLHRDHGRIELIQSPVLELAALRGTRLLIAARTLGADPYRLPLPRGAGKAAEIIAEFSPQSAREFGLAVDVGGGERTRIGYDVATQSLFIDRSRSGKIPAPIFAERKAVALAPRDGLIRLHLLLDWSSIEVFADDGAVVMTEQLFPSPHSDRIEVYSEGGEALLRRLDFWPLRTAH
ncbi:MAG: glycoside hydrolase family 32 protein [Steroidobacteraceae bacterium]|jgi:fructan beta-fructosidase